MENNAKAAKSFRERAAELLERADTASPEGRDAYIKLAGLWAKLAEELERRRDEPTEKLRRSDPIAASPRPSKRTRHL